MLSLCLLCNIIDRMSEGMMGEVEAVGVAPSAHAHFSISLFSLLRGVFYLLVMVKIVALAFFRRRTMTIK